MEHDPSVESSRAALDERLNRLSPDDRTQVLARLAVRRRSSARPSVISRRGLSTAPMSFGQQRLWFVHLLEPANLTYIIGRLYFIAGPLDIEALRRAFDEVLRRHEVLRTTYHLVDGEPLQRVEPHAPFRLPVHRLDHLPAEDRRREIERLRADDVRASFDLARDVMLRAQLARLSDDEHVLIVVQHHIASDRWSVANLHRELSLLYDAYVRGEGSPLADLPIQYADYASWQREELTGETLERHLSYWRGRLQDVPDGLSLPTDRRPSREPGVGGDEIVDTIPAELAARLRHLAGTSNATPYMLYVAALKVLLHRYGAGDDILVGSPIAGRLGEETERLIGFFVNTLVLRSSLAGDPPFSALLRQVRASLLEAYDHQRLPFERLVAAIDPARDVGKNPLIQVMMAYQNTPFEPLRLGALRVEPMSGRHDIEPFPLNLHLVDGHDALDVSLRYQTDHFSRGRIRQLLAHYRTLLEGIADAPDRRLSQLPLMGADEMRWLTTGLNPLRVRPDHEPAPVGLVHQLVEAQVARTPEAIAVVDEECAVTYRELDGRAARLAGELRDLGVGPETLVGLALDRTVDMVVGILGILKAGGAFVPMDPDAPAARWHQVISDAGLGLVVAVSTQAANLAGSTAKGLYLDAPRADDPEGTAPPGRVPTATATSAAYVLYTSGSTGQPKGVVVEHRHLVEYVRAAAATYQYDQGGSFAMVQPVTVDACQTVLFPSLAWGGTLHLFSRETALDVSALAAAVEGRRIDHLKTAPTHLSALLSASPDARRLLPRKTLVLGGEPLQWSLVARLVELGASCEVWNHYGPTETTVGVLTWRIDLKDATRTDRSPTVPIGHPFGRVTAYVLDDAGNLVPPGAQGELYIGGATVARGYLNRPELTAAVFVPDPIGGLSGTRLYRTGDLVRRLADGAVEFIGRRDSQVKLRGFRVEPGEIEATLSGHGAVRECVVLVREMVPGDPALVAYVTVRPEHAISTADLRAFVAERLPAHMVPSAFVVLADMPRTAHGKINRRALPPPDRDHLADGDRTRVAPRTATEEAIGRIWAEVLGTHAFGIHDNFFEIGGHSLLVLQITGRVQASLGVALPPRVLFDAPTVAALAARLEASPANPSDAAREEPTAVAPLSFSQERLWFIDQLEPGNTTYTMPSAVRLRGPLDVAALGRTFDTLVDRHAILRTAFKIVGDEPRQCVLRPGPVPMPVVDLGLLPAAEREAEAARLASEDARRPFDLLQAPPFRVSLLRLAENDHVLLVTLHHIASDGWSKRVLWREIGALYEAFVAGRPSPLAPLPIQYFEYAARQRDTASDGRLDELLAYWRASLDGLIPLELPTDRPRPARPAHRGQSCETVLDGALAGALLDLGHRERATLFMTLAAAFQLLLARQTGRDDIAVGTPVANRNSPDLENLIGVFVNTVVLRTRLESAWSFRDLLAHVRDVALGAFDHHELPFETLVRHLQPERDPSRSPLFQVLVNMGVSDDRGSDVRLPGLYATVDARKEPEAKYDLTLYLWTTGPSLNVKLVYDRDLFDHERMAELLEQYVSLLRQIAEAPNRALADYSLVTGRAKALLPDPARPIDAVPYSTTVVDDVLTRAAEAPARPAIRTRDGSWTYGDLARASIALAHALTRDGLRPGDVVALEGAPGFGLIAGLLGVMRAGGVVLPLDRRLPEGRKALMVDHAGASVVLSADVAEPDRWWNRHARPLQWLDVPAGISRGLEDAARDDLLPHLSPDASAYVFFTSGTTGVPKGILGHHQGLTHFVTWQRQTFAVGPDDIVAHLTSMSFDVVLREIFVALTSGALLCVPTDEGIVASPDVLTWLATERVTVVHAVPSVVRQWLEDGVVQEIRWSPRMAFFAGEPLTQALVRRWWQAFPASRIVNLYGPSETCLAKAAYEIPREPRPGVQPLGRALPHAQLLILNQAGHLCGLGEPGEIVIRTPFGTRGYLPTAPLEDHRRFRPNPFSRTPDDLVYYSGDAGRYAVEGTVEILGRLDEQVKLRGVRLEPREIEAVLEGHGAVTAAAVVVRPDERGDDSLIAYVVGADVDWEELRAHVARFVPRSMVPNRFVVLDSLPLTPNGKVDRRRLPEPDPERPELSTPFVAPRNPVETAIAHIWQEVLGLARVGVHDNFFALGGHSLLATRVLARLRSHVNSTLPLVEFFEAPTVAELAVRLEAPERQPRSKESPRVEQRQSDGNEDAVVVELANICRDVLWLPSLGVDDDLVDHGCHSLTASIIRSRISALFGVDIPLPRLLQSCSVRTLAGLVGRATPSLRRPSRTSSDGGVRQSPLSSNQQAIWFKQQLWPEAPLFNEPYTIYFGTAIDAAALEAAVNQIVARHDMLRMTVVEHGEPRLVVHESAHLAVGFVNLTALPEEDREARALAVARAEATRPFDLSRAPLVRATLVRVGPDDDRLYVTCHHLVIDAYAFYRVLVPELSVLYARACGRPGPVLPPPDPTFTECVGRLAELAAGSRWEQHVRFWSGYLQDASAVALPRGSRGGELPKPDGACERLTLDAQLTTDLKRLSRESHATLFTALLTAFYVLLTRHTSQRDLTVATVDAGRGQPGFERVLGCLANVMAVRVDLSGDPTAREAIRRVTRAALDVYEHTDIPPGLVLQRAEGLRGTAWPLLLNVAFVMEPSQPLYDGGWRVSQLDVNAGVSKFDLLIQVEEEAGTLVGKIEYLTELFDKAAVSGLACEFQALLGGMVESPDVPISRLLNPAPHETKPGQGPSAAARGPHGGDRCLHEWFEQQVARTPDAVALTFGQASLTYGELDRRAGALAYELQTRGVRPGTLVGLCLERGFDLVVGVLGILKAGGAYVPIDPAYPADRASFILRDTLSPLVLTHASLADRFAGGGAATLCLDTWTPASTTVTGCAWGRPDDLAYVIYTSGTTGRPKGTLVTHRNVVRLLESTQAWFGFDHDDVWTLFHSVAFDFSVWEMWGALLYGGRLVIVPREIARSPDEFHALLGREGVTVLNQTPSALRGLIEVDRLAPPHRPLALRYIILGGEALPMAMLRPWFARHGDEHPRVVNMYGITETTVHVTYRPVTAGDLDGPSLIGRPIPDLEVYLLDNEQRVVPEGTTGEIYVGGAGVARGYLNLPDLTRERFVALALNGQPPRRFYRSGDLARRREDGDLEYLGRADHQVKVRGHRVELGEIEAVLARHAGVQACVVVAQEGRPGDTRLVGYVVGRDGSAPTRTELVSHLQTALPEYMVPAAFVMLQALPLTENGKIDRLALPAPSDAGHERESLPEAPRTREERVLAQIWADVLKLERVGIHDNFFQLGGHSLLVVTAVDRARRLLSTEVAFREIFEAPTVAQLAARIAGRAQTAERPAFDGPPAGADEARPIRAPLSFAQQRLWFLCQLEPASVAYNMAYAWHVRGALDSGALRLALQSIVDRHAVLRTTFAMRDAESWQVIHPAGRVELPVVELSTLPVADGQDEAARLVAAEAARAFDLERDHPFRASLVRLAADEHVLLLTVHHIASDGWSNGVLWRELEAFYAAHAHGVPTALPPLPWQYADFAAWQRTHLEGERLATQLDYWRRRLEGLSPLELPTDEPRPPHPSYRGARCQFTLDAQLATELRALSRRERITPFMMLVAAFQLLLARYSGQEDVAVGTPIANRVRPEVEPLVGFFVNTLVIRTSVAGDPSFRDLLGRVRETALDAYDHQDLPFEKLVEELRPERDLSRNPLVQVLFAHQGRERTPPALAGLHLESFRVNRQNVRFDLELHMVDGLDGQLRGNFVYSTDLFHANSIERLAHHFEELLRQIVRAPDTAVSELTCLSERETHDLLLARSRTAPLPADPSIHRLVERQVERTPGHVAVLDGERALTYEQLNARANRLARLLHDRGVRHGDRVALCLERSTDMLVATLAILKTGAAYVPLDPAHPDARIALLLAESQPRLVLTTAVLHRRLAAGGVHVAYLDLRPGLVDTGDDTRLDTSCAADDVAYVLFTSGSTGRPKGVAMGHGALANLIAWHQQHERLGRPRRTLQFAPLTFDVSFQEIFTTWCTGGTIVLVPEEMRRDPSALLRHIITQRVERLFVPYVALRQLVDAAARDGLDATTLEDIVSAGESLLLPEEVRRFVGRLPDCRLHNHYGPTETHVVTAFTLAPDTDGWPGTCPIGQPLPNVRIYVLDQRMQPVPVGVTGELCVGGVSLAQGYLNQPGLTGERFVPNPHVPGERLYRTGDLARWRDDGQLDFLGRKDGQVKIRGYRVELEEIEVVLGNHPKVGGCAVTAREDPPGDRRLVAYVEGDAATVPSRDELVRHLRARLPDYMVPSVFVVLPALPLTPNGKVDRRSLPAPPRGGDSADHRYKEPRTPVEQTVAGVWEEVLAHDGVGVDDNFFDLGGHSLLATRVIARLRVLFDPDLPLRVLFEAPTVAQLAARLVEAEGARRRPPATPDAVEAITVRAGGDTAPLSFAQQRLWFLHQLDPDSAAYNLSQAWHLEGALDAAALGRALEAVVHRHATLRTTFTVVDGEPRQRIRPPGPFALPVVDLGALSGTERQQAVTARAVAEAHRPFDLATDGPIRAKLLRLGADDHVLLLTLHHIAGDAWSLGVLWRELSALYVAECAGQAARLPSLPVQYADFALWQRERLQGERLERHLAYWRTQLEGLSPLELPCDHPRPTKPSHRGGYHRFRLDPDLVARLRELAAAEGATLFMALLAASQLLLARYADQDDIAVATPFSNRERPDVEHLIGFFVNTIVLRAHLGGHPSFRELLARVRQTTIDAHDHQDLPFEKLVEELHPERDLGRNPLAQVVVALQNASDTVAGLPGIRTRAIQTGAARVRFDLEIHLRETDGGAVTGTLIYATDLFEAKTVEAMARHFELLLHGLVEQPEAPVTTISLLTDEERRQLLVDWNATAAPLPDQPVHRLFEAQASHTPGAVALVWRDQQVTYGDLNERANRLARHLAGQGVSNDVVVGLALERSVEVVTALLAVLKAGGAYLPLDPRDPPGRLRRVLEDSQARVLVAGEGLDTVLGAAVDHVVRLDRDAPAIARQPASNLDIEVASGALAYVMYTSGSTGVPKGVEIPHRAIVRLVYADVVPMGPSDTVLQLAPLTFDASTFEIWAPLLRGARVALYPAPTLDLPELEGVLRRERVSHLWLTASLFNAVVDTRPAALSGLSWVLAGGEALSLPHVTRALDACPTLRLFNGYGPTEVTTFSCIHPIDRRELDATASIPIGRPIANTTAYVLDRSLQPVPIGVSGDLYLGGAGLARGYRHRPDLTAERFIASPFVPGERVYATGDRVRYGTDGRLEFLGRKDNQVKLRGFRIELGEVEAVLAQHPAVKACAVAVIEDDAAGKRLVAYVAPPDGATLAVEDVVHFLRSRLPNYMVPSVVVPVAALPLTTGGKVDRRALPRVSSAPAAEERNRPLSSTEVTLASLWREILRVSDIAPSDSFFNLGGHSLLAVRLLSRIERDFGKRVPMSTLFTHGSLEELALLLDGLVEAKPWSPLVPIQAGGTRPPLFLVHGIGGEVAGFRSFARHLGSDQPLYGIQAAGPGAEHALSGEVVELASHYADIIVDTWPTGPCFVTGYSAGGPMALEVAQQLLGRGKQVAVLVLLDAGLPRVPGTNGRPARRLTPLRLGRHLFYWLTDDALVAGTRDLAQRAGVKVRVLKARVRRWLGLAAEGPDLFDVLGLHNTPDQYRAYIRERYEAFRRYQPRSYAGRVALVRGRARPLFKPWGPEEHWKHVAAGGLDVHLVRGNHVNVLSEPYVVDLARAVRACLDRALEQA